MIHAYKYLAEGNKENEASLFSALSTDRTRGNEHKLKHETQCEHKKTLLSVQVVKHRN